MYSIHHIISTNDPVNTSNAQGVLRSEMPSRVESTRKHEKVIKDETKQACAMQGNLCILEMCNGCVQSLQSVQLCNLCMENEGMQCHADNFFSFLFFFCF